MKFLADENCEGAVVRGLRAEGHEVSWIRDVQPEAIDSEVIERARREARVLLTNDKDFAELAYLKHEATSGIVLLRMPAFGSKEKLGRLLATVNQLGEGLAGSFTVVTPGATRRRPLPASSDRG